MKNGGKRIEREVKLAAWPGFVMPDLVDPPPPVDPAAASDPEAPPPAPPPVRVVGQAPIELDAVYHDTEDCRLARRGVTLRRRVEGGESVVWTLKLPAHGTGGIALARRELDVVSGGDEPPPELAGLLTAYVRDEPLAPVAHLHTVRRSLSLLDPTDAPLGQIDDDDVTVLDDGEITAKFREIEVELAPEAPDALVKPIVRRLRAAGAGAPDPTPKLVRAVGPRALAPPELAPRRIGPDATTAELIRSGITNAVMLVLDHDHVIRLDDDIEGVHQARVGTRRLRSDLRTYGPYLQTRWAESLRRELGWYAGELGRVRDLDVLLVRFHRQIAALPEEADRVAGAKLIARLQQERDRELTRLLRLMGTRRYVRLLDRLVRAADRPLTTVEARLPARATVPELVEVPWRKLRRTVRALGPDPADEALHATRIRVKRARYAVDVAVPVIGKPARDLAKALGGVQDVLGDHNDAVVATARLRALAARAPRDEVLVAGQLIAIQAEETGVLREEWNAAWKQVAHKRLTSWIG